MIKTLFTIAVAVLSTSAMAQTDSAKIKIKQDTIKSKETGAFIMNGKMMAFGPQADSTKAKTKSKPAAKPDTLKTGSLKSSALFYAMSPQTDSLKAKPNSVDTVKTGSKYATVLDANAFVAYNSEDGPQTDSTKTKPASIKPDTSTTKPVDKRTGAIQIDRSLLKNEILKA
ncbi:hypothetical protein [Cytophaga aurantiaca]|uniref:hypothetical protein n=1 Tax=Cytophaga aurantiaca TaxID=29530 RepID=UPI0003621E94|nr:hypothetical protein [Cytophaga aurantiaca]